MTLKKALCTVAFGIVLLAANTHAQTIPPTMPQLLSPTRLLWKGPEWLQTNQSALPHSGSGRAACGPPPTHRGHAMAR